MAYIKMYSYFEGDTGTLAYFNSTKDIDEITNPEVKMASINYFSIEGRQLSISFFSSEDSDQYYTQLITNKNSNINSRHPEVMNIFTEVYNDDDELVFAGVVGSEYEYDDYDEMFTDIKIYDGLHCFLKYHMEALPDIEIDEPFYSNIYEPNLGTLDYGDKIEDIDNIAQFPLSNAKRYYYLIVNGINNGTYLNNESLISSLNLDLFYYHFPMAVEGLEDISIEPQIQATTEFESDKLSRIQKTWLPKSVGDKDISVDDLYNANGVWYSSLDDYAGDVQVPSHPIIEDELGNEIVNEEFYFHKREIWCRLYAGIFDNGYVHVTTNNIEQPQPDVDTATLVAREIWYVHFSHVLTPSKYTLTSYYNEGFGSTYYDNQRINIVKYRFWAEGTDNMWFDKAVTYERTVSKVNYNSSGYYRNLSMKDNMQGYNYELSGTVHNQFYRLWNKTFGTMIGGYSFYINNPTFIPNRTSIFNTTRIYSYNEDLSDYLWSNIGYDNSIAKITSKTVLSNRALLLNGDTNLTEILKASLIISNVSMIGLNTGNIRFIEKLKDVIDPSANTFYLDESNTRSKYVVSLPKTFDSSFSDIFFYSNTIAGVTEYFYKNVFANFIGERQFTSMRFAFNTEPTINDIIVFRNKNYWINSIKLSNDYQSYIIKAYEVI